MIIARNLNDQTETRYASREEVYRNIGVDSKILKARYLNKPKQYNGLTFRDENKPYWNPPDNFHFNEAYNSSRNVFIKGTHKTTNEVVYYNSAVEAAQLIPGLYDDIEFNENNIENLRKTISSKGVNKNKHPILSQYTWEKIDQCGQMIHNDGTIEQLVEVRED
jgi:hypothetical protein